MNDISLWFVLPPEKSYNTFIKPFHKTPLKTTKGNTVALDNWPALSYDSVILSLCSCN